MKLKCWNPLIVILLLVFLSSCSKTKVFSEKDISIIPKPAHLELKSGVFEFTQKTKFVVKNEEQMEISDLLIKKFKKAEGWKLEMVNEIPNKNYVQYITDDSLEDEAYNLIVDSNKIVIKAKGITGFIYGLESIRQLLPITIESNTMVENEVWIVPNLEIKDRPRFKWRGLMLDVSRHFFKKEYIKKVIDGLAMHKMNVLHLHLVDDQGWRIEIKKYPKLTEIGAFRLDQEDAHWDGRRVTTPADTATYGGFYTQDDIKDIVSYASSRGVEVIPEIEMPAHVMSAIASYPELSCFENPIGVPSGGVWPITEIYCAGKESTFEFLENVLLEVMVLFPSKYIHVGGDEATKTNWSKCPHCKKRMQENNLKDVNELQSYFIKRMEAFINSHDKKLLGWDEIIEGGLAPDATVMSWRGVQGGVEATAHGHDVVMTPGTHCYFDHYQGPQNEEPLAWGGYTPLSKVYEFDPIVDGMDEEQAAHVLGGQANLWSEQIKTESHSEYMIFPRLAAMSEALWSPKEPRDWNDFSERITSLMKRYEHLGINYAKSAYLITADVNIDMDTKEVDVHLKNEFPNTDIRYSLDSDTLSDFPITYNGPIKLTQSTTINASLFTNGEPIGTPFQKIIKFHKGVGKKVSFKDTFHKNYQGEGEFTLLNTLRGSKNFHDGHWQAWLNKDMEAIIDLEKETEIHQVKLGAMENQGPGIYFPIEVKVLLSDDGKKFKEVGHVMRAYEKNPTSDLKDFVVDFSQQKARYVKVIAINLKSTPEGNGVFLFVDEILID